MMLAFKAPGVIPLDASRRVLLMKRHNHPLNLLRADSIGHIVDTEMHLLPVRHVAKSLVELIMYNLSSCLACSQMSRQTSSLQPQSRQWKLGSGAD